MNPIDMPQLIPYRYHAMICAGKNCETGLSLVKYLRQHLLEKGLDEGDGAVRVNRAACLGVCTGGPIMVVYPAGVWYCGLNEAVMDRIIESHFTQHRVLKGQCFYMNEEEG